MTGPWWTPIAIQLALVAPVAIFFAWALRHSGVPGGKRGGGALGGLIAAILLGPAVLGRAAPDFHSRIFTGGTAESAALDAAAAEVRVRLAALRATDVSEIAITEAARDADAELQPLRDAHLHAMESHATNSWWLIVALASLHAAMGIATLFTPSARIWSRAARSLWDFRARPALAGVLALLLAAAPVALALSFAPGLPGPALIAATLIFVVPAFTPTAHSPASFAAALTAFTVGLILFFAVTPTLQMFTIAAFACFGAMMSLGWPAPLRCARKALTSIMATITLPALVALAGVHIDPAAWTLNAPASHFIIPMLIAILWASDGRWAALHTAARLLRLRDASGWTPAARHVNAGSSSIELVLAITAFASGLLDERVLAAALVGVVVIEMTRGLRLTVARLLDSGDDSIES